MTKSNDPNLQSTQNSSRPGFRVVAYVTDAAVASVIPYDKLTHINFAFLLPNEDGTFQELVNTWLIGQLVPLAHKQNVKVLISVGGWGWDAQFEKMAANPSTRTAFVKNLVKIVALYQFDGADIDWEYPDAGASAQNFLALMQELRRALPKGSLLTAAVVALGEHGAGIPSESFAQMDFVNIMAYDDSGPQHSSLNYAVSALDYWLERGLPPEKATLGVPFYARPTETPYAQIVKDNPAAAQLDSTLFNGVQINYNGIPTIQAKTRLALQRASGIMFWTLENDASGDLSLLSAIHQVVVNAKN
jgi:chitinase